MIDNEEEHWMSQLSRLMEKANKGDIDAKNRLQHCGLVHPYTCGNEDCVVNSERTILTATNEGWKCPKCGYEQSF